MSELLTYFNDQKQAMIDLLTELVNYESPTKDKAAVDKLGAVLEAKFKEFGADSVTTYARDTVGNVKLAKWNENADGKPILFLVHIDTVWDIGTLAERPVTIDDEGRLFGPGAVDMKGGIVVALTAIRGLIEQQQLPDRPIWLLMTTDEEMGSDYSKELIKELAPQAELVMVMEPGTPEGALKIWRKGVARFRVSVKGRASHAGNFPEQGINAIVEIAQQIVKINKLNDLRNGTSVSVTVIEGGTTSNVIPAHASILIDVRTLSTLAAQDVHNSLTNLHPMMPGAEITVELLSQRPPMEYNDTARKALEQVKRIGTKYGVTVREEGVGGGSDGNFTAALGVPTVDGLGPQGDGLHALHEHVIINSLPKRATLCAGILLDWVDVQA